VASGVGSAVGPGVGVASGVGASVGVVSGVGAAVGSSVGVGVASGVGSAVGVASGVGAGVGVASGVGSGLAKGSAAGTGVGAALAGTVGVGEPAMDGLGPSMGPGSLDGGSVTATDGVAVGRRPGPSRCSADARVVRARPVRDALCVVGALLADGDGVTGSVGAAESAGEGLVTGVGSVPPGTIVPCGGRRSSAPTAPARRTTSTAAPKTSAIRDRHQLRAGRGASSTWAWMRRARSV
jgi:hypothetical protein